MAWKSAIFLPKARRCFAYFTASSSAPCARPTDSAAMPMRPPSSALRAIFRPWPSSPRRFSSGHFAIVQNNFDGRRAALAHFLFVAAGAEAGESGLDEKSADTLSARGRIGFREDHENAGDAAVGDPGFGALQFVDGSLRRHAPHASGWRRRRSRLALRSGKTRREFLQWPGGEDIFSFALRWRNSASATARRNLSR